MADSTEALQRLGGLAESKGFTVSWEKGDVFGFAHYNTQTAEDAERAHKAEYPDDTITEVTAGPITMTYRHDV